MMVMVMAPSPTIPTTKVLANLISNKCTDCSHG